MKAKIRSFSATLIVAPAKGVHSRQMPGVLVVDISRHVRLANEASVAMLQPIVGPEARLVLGAVERNQGLVERSLVGHMASAQRTGDASTLSQSTAQS